MRSVRVRAPAFVAIRVFVLFGDFWALFFALASGRIENSGSLISDFGFLGVSALGRCLGA